MCCVMPPASPLATRVRRIESSSDVLPWSTWPITVTTGGRGSAVDARAPRDSASSASGSSSLAGLRLVPHFLDQDHRGFLVEHLVDRDHLAQLHQRLDDLGGLHRHLVREIGDGDRLGNRDFADDRPGRAARRAFAAFLVVATRAADLGLAPAGRRGAAGDVAAQLERAPARRFFLERGAALLDRARLLARLRRRPMQRAFGRRLGLRRGVPAAAPRRPLRRPSRLPPPRRRPPPWPRLPRLPSPSSSCAWPPAPASAGFPPAGARSAPAPSSPPPRAPRAPRR